MLEAEDKKLLESKKNETLKKETKSRQRGRKVRYSTGKSNKRSVKYPSLSPVKGLKLINFPILHPAFEQAIKPHFIITPPNDFPPALTCSGASFAYQTNGAHCKDCECRDHHVNHYRVPVYDFHSPSHHHLLPHVACSVSRSDVVDGEQITPYGRVTSKVVDGTTYYHYERPIDPQSRSGEVHASTQNAFSCFPANINFPQNSSCSSYLIPPPNACISEMGSVSTTVSYKSTSSSRCSSPFLVSNDSASINRDSGLVSTESTDEEVHFDNDDNLKNHQYEKILQLVTEAAEKALSDEQLLKDAYLLRQMRRNRHGYISIKLLANTKSIKRLTRDHKTLVMALQHSDILEINEAGTKVKRNTDLPEKVGSYKANMYLLLINVPTDDDIEKITKRFKEYGAIEQVRIVRPNRPLPQYLHNYATVFPELGKVMCAVVEFERETSTYAAYKGTAAQDTNSAAILGSKFQRRIRKIQEKAANCQDTIPASQHLSKKSENDIFRITKKVVRHNSGESIDSNSADSGIFHDE
ncbi:uncharacterized protein LOC143464576 [Clavelina lepadiformis]|uniref:HTH La-type RNA-binding domain-containing protein n=1 Tax=Clavelina lepadiformis TaxID=159417 RepID=A0ABP0FZE9_CLALP